MPLMLDPVALERSVCKDSFYQFLKRFWSTVISEEPVWNWHIEFLCDELQRVAERVFRNEPKEYDLVINVPPGSTKSTIASIMFPVWCWTRMPTCRVISSSHAHSLATTLSRKSRMIVESDKWVKLFPEIVLSDVQNAKHYWVNTDGGERQAVGTGGMILGNHAHLIVVDDPIDPIGARSEAELTTAKHHIKETLSGRKVDQRISVMVLIQQRMHQRDPSAILLDEAKQPNGTPVRHLCLPGEASKRSQVRPRKMFKYYVDGLLDPVRFSRKILGRMKARLGQYGYAGQVLQSPVPPGGGMFKVDKIRIEDPPLPRHMKKIVRYWDKAGTQDGGTFTAGAKLGEDAKGRLWILDMVLGQWDSGNREAMIKQTAQLDGAEYVEIGVEQEPGSGGKDSALSTISNLKGFRVRADRPTGSKVTRADTFSVQVNGENVSMAPGLWNGRCLEELRFFPFSKNKDQVDALSGAFKLLTKPRKRAGGIKIS